MEREELAARRASLLLLALRLHRAEKGAIPATLDALAPGYLPAVPLDPYDDRPFRYRISKGESIAMESIPAPIPGKPETFAALLGGSGYGANGRVDDHSDRTGAYLDRCGALLGGLGHEVERDPSHYLLDRFGGPAGGGDPIGFPPPLAPVVRMLDLPAGRGILWSVGPDKIDDGGKVWADPKTGASTTVRTGDLIYPVPEPAQPKR